MMKATSILKITAILILCTVFPATIYSQSAVGNGRIQINESELLRYLDFPSLRWNQLEGILRADAVPADRDPRRFVRFRDVARIFVVSDGDLVQSIGFRLFRNAGAAFRDLQHLEFIPAERSGGSHVSGRDLLSLLNRYDVWFKEISSNYESAELSQGDQQ